MEKFNMLFLLIALVITLVESQDEDDLIVYKREYLNCEDPDIVEPWEGPCVPTESFGCSVGPAYCAAGNDPWSAWSTCRGRCGRGKRQRTRTCSNAINGGQACVGPSRQQEPCIPNGCPNIRLCKDKEDWCVKLTGLKD